MEMPEANKRIKSLIDGETKGKVLPYLNMLNEVTGERKLSHQRLNRLFSVDTRTNSWPTVPIDILEAILLRFPDVDAYWLITGKEKSDSMEPDLGLRTQMQSELDAMRASLQKLSELVPLVQAESSIQEVTYSQKLEGKTR